jgi:hypothetical protein
MTEDDDDINVMPGQMKNLRKIVNKCINEYMNNEMVIIKNFSNS